MGIILSRFRAKKTTIEILEDLESKIKEIQEYGQNTEHRHKKIIGTLVIYSVVLYITTAFIFYFYFFPASLYDQLFYIIPLLIFPILILFTKKMVSWYYKRKISQNQEKLVTMQREKTKILDEVTETETYKKAKDILLRFAPDQLKMTATPGKAPPSIDKLRQPSIPQAAMSPMPNSGELRRRTIGHPNQLGNVPSGPTSQMAIIGATPIKSPQLSTSIQTTKVLSSTPMNYTMPERTLARPILSHQKSYFDRLIDYLVGDGPSNRYALICQQCVCHNGMALKEEFEYLGFRCCYCNFWNPPRKQKPGAPKLDDTGHSSTASESPVFNSPEKGVETVKLAEASCSSDTDSDIEVVESPTEISEQEKSVADESSNTNEKEIKNEKKKAETTNPFYEDMEDGD